MLITLLLLNVSACAVGKPLPSYGKCYNVYKVGLARVVRVDFERNRVMWYTIPLDEYLYVTPINEFALAASAEVPCFREND